MSTITQIRQPHEEDLEHLEAILSDSTLAEQALLATMLMCPWDHGAAGDLEAGDFQNSGRGKLFEQIKRRQAAAEPLDYALIVAEAQEQGYWVALGEMKGFTGLWEYTPQGSTGAYASIVRLRARRRAARDLCRESLEACADSSRGDPVDLLAAGIEQIRPIREAEAESLVVAGTELAGALASVAAGERPGCIMVMPTSLHFVMGGLRAGRLTILGARPAQGKSTLAWQLACELVTSGKTRATYVSLEMPIEELAVKAWANKYGVNSDAIMDSKSLPDPEALAYLRQLEAGGLRVVTRKPQTLLDLQALCRRAAYDWGSKVLILDYLQLLYDRGGPKQRSRAQELADISSGLKEMALETKMAIIVVAMIRRDHEEKKGPPQLSELKDSGAIEQDADVVLMLHELPEAEARKRWPLVEYAGRHDAIVEVRVRKNRMGKLGACWLLYRKPWHRFEETRMLELQSEEGK